MTRSDYLSNSSKILLICSSLLFANSALGILGGVFGGVKGFAGSFTTICFYGVLILGFLAFNGEGIAYKHTKATKKRKATVILKLLLVSVFLFRYVKTPVTSLLLGFDATTIGGVVSRLFMSFLNTTASYGFFMLIVAIWFVVRDKSSKNVAVLSLLSVFSGLIYNSFKFVNYAITKYDILVETGFLSDFFANETVLDILALVQFGFNIVMCFVAFRYFETLVADEHEEREKNTKKMITARNIYTTDCVGIDTLEDDYLL